MRSEDRITEGELKAKLLKVAGAIASGVEATWQDVLNRFPEHTFFAFALSTIDDAIHVSASANSVQNHQKICEENDLAPGTPDEEYYRWCPCEWGELEYIGEQVFKRADVLLADLYVAGGDGDWDSYREGIIQAMVDGLGRAAAAGVFGRGEERAGITLFVTIYDSFDTEQIEHDSARMLNPASVYERFSNRFAATKKQKQDESTAQQARQDSLSELSHDQQANRYLQDFKENLSNSVEGHLERFKRERQILDLMIRVGKPMVKPIIEAMAGGIEKPIGTEGYALMKVLRNIGPELDDELHGKLAALIIQYCEYNAGSAKWQVTPFHIAQFLHDYSCDEYPYPSMEGNNALRDYERFLEIARRHVV